MSYPSRPQLVSKSNRANIGQKFKPLHEFRVPRIGAIDNSHIKSSRRGANLLYTRRPRNSTAPTLLQLCVFVQFRPQRTFRCRILELSTEFLSTIYCSQATG